MTTVSNFPCIILLYPVAPFGLRAVSFSAWLTWSSHLNLVPQLFLRFCGFIVFGTRFPETTQDQTASAGTLTSGALTSRVPKLSDMKQRWGWKGDLHLSGWEGDHTQEGLSATMRLNYLKFVPGEKHRCWTQLWRWIFLFLGADRSRRGDAWGLRCCFR